MSGCAPELLSALVDGALGHDERDRVLAHLTGCPPCRAELDAQRRVKARVAGLAAATPAPPDRLVRALQQLAVPGAEPVRRPSPSTRAALVRPGARSAAGPGRRPRRRASRVGVVGGALLAVGVGVALLLGAPRTTPSTPVDPASDDFVVDFVSTTGGVPLADPVDVVATLPRR